MLAQVARVARRGRAPRARSSTSARSSARTASASARGGAPELHRLVAEHASASRPSRSRRAAGRRRRDEVAIDAATAEEQGLQASATRSARSAGAGARATRSSGIAKIGGADSFGGATVVDRDPARGAAHARQGRPASTRSTSRPSRGVTPAAARGAAARGRCRARVDVRTGSEQAAKQSKRHPRQPRLPQTRCSSFAGVALFVGAFLIFNTFSITVAQRTREFALLRTLGASRGQMLRTVVAEALLLGVVGVGRSASPLGSASRGARGAVQASASTCPRRASSSPARTIDRRRCSSASVVTPRRRSAPALRATRVPPVDGAARGRRAGRARGGPRLATRRRRPARGWASG